MWATAKIRRRPARAGSAHTGSAGDRGLTLHNRWATTTFRVLHPAAAPYRLLADGHQLIDRVLRKVSVDDRPDLHFGEFDCALVIVEECDVSGVTPSRNAHQ